MRKELFLTTRVYDKNKKLIAFTSEETQVSVDDVLELTSKESNLDYIKSSCPPKTSFVLNVIDCKPVAIQRGA